LRPVKLLRIGVELSNVQLAKWKEAGLRHCQEIQPDEMLFYHKFTSNLQSHLCFIFIQINSLWLDYVEKSSMSDDYTSILRHICRILVTFPCYTFIFYTLKSLNLDWNFGVIFSWKDIQV
jgi:hypothetical protein